MPREIIKKQVYALGAGLLLTLPQSGVAAESAPASADARAQATEQQMTDAERFSLLISLLGPNNLSPARDPRIPQDVPPSAGFTPGVPRLGIPNLTMTDASMGITNPGYREGDTATALPASLALASSFNLELARETGAMLGREAKSKGFNVLLGGGMNLTRDPRNGRNFEYLSEDPLLSAAVAAEAIKGTQGEGVISMVKHFSLNANEKNRHWLDAVIDPAAHRESDLLAFQMAIERAEPGSIMCAYNKVNGDYACGNDGLLNGVLKNDWGYKGWVMSDWGAVYHWDYALKGLDQESGAQLDKLFHQEEWFNEPLRKAYEEGKLSRERLSDMVRRILRSVYAVGADQPAGKVEPDLARHHQVALEGARQGMVLLKNDGLLPLDADAEIKVAVIGGHAQIGVATGTGSSAVTPPGGYAAVIKVGGEGYMGGARNLYLLPSSPLEELKKLMPKAKFSFDPGIYPAEAAAVARRADIVVAIGIRPEGEGFDQADLSLPWGQDAVIEAVAAANPNTLVVLQTGNPSAMPWLGKARAVLQAWYPGQAGGQAIAEILTGAVNPSGRLPLTFPADLAQLPRPVAPGLDVPWGVPLQVKYEEGAEVGYRWFAKHGEKPLFAFGHGLSYTRFAYADLEVIGGETISASFTVTNTGKRAGADVPQLYLTDAAGDKRMRLLGFERVELEPGESRRVTLQADPRLLARFDGQAKRWRIDAGQYRVALGQSAVELAESAEVELQQRLFGR
ncbi:Thermostable beta-glucosidase B [compost metagenome]